MEKYGYLSKEEADQAQALSLELDYANLESEGPANYFLEQVKMEAEGILKDVNKEAETQYDLRKSGLVIETTLSLELQLAAQKALQEQLERMQPKLSAQYREASHKRILDQLVDKRIEELGLAEEAGQMAMRELFTWQGFYTDSISVRDSLMHNLTLLHAGFVAMDPRDGEVKAWIGGIDHRTHPYDQVFAQRQSASAFKPVLYASALEQGAMPCQYLDNDPIVLRDFEGWAPNNYDHSFGGKYSVSAALAKSMNVPTVNLFFQQDFDSLQGTWNRLGFSQELKREPSSALGTSSASLYEMAMAYASFANGGKKVSPKMIRSIKTSSGKVLFKAERDEEQERVLQPQASQLLTAMLQKAVNEGTGGALRGRYGVNLPLAGKTGTSQDYADAWFIGYSPNLVLATRVGASFPVIHFDRGNLGSGSALALPIVAGTLKSVQRSAALKNRFFVEFEALPDDYAYALQCEDYIDDTEVEKFFERVFDSRTTTFEKASKKAQRKARKKKGFFQRLFGKKDN
jgi:penicillin-binding protein 1A